MSETEKNPQTELDFNQEPEEPKENDEAKAPDIVENDKECPRCMGTAGRMDCDRCHGTGYLDKD